MAANNSNAAVIPKDWQTTQDSALILFQDVEHH